jgi:hypothetical protein
MLHLTAGSLLLLLLWGRWLFPPLLLLLLLLLRVQGLRRHRTWAKVLMVLPLQ